MKRFSILQEEKKCLVCNKKIDLHIHEVFYGRNRNNSIKDGCCVFLCSTHHNMSDKGIHFNKKLDLEVKIKMEKRWCEYYNKTPEDFLERYKINYL